MSAECASATCHNVEIAVAGKRGCVGDRIIGHIVSGPLVALGLVSWEGTHHLGRAAALVQLSRERKGPRSREPSGKGKGKRPEFPGRRPPRDKAQGSRVLICFCQIVCQGPAPVEPNLHLGYPPTGYQPKSRRVARVVRVGRAVRPNDRSSVPKYGSGRLGQ